MTHFHSVRTAGLDPVVLDGGDFLFSINDYYRISKPGQRTELMEKAKLIVEAYNRLGYDAAGIGECELMAGIDDLERLSKTMKFPLLCANIVDEKTGEPLFPASTTLERDGMKIGVVSALMDTLTPAFRKSRLRGAKITPPLPALSDAIKALGDVDVVFVLAHLNHDDVAKMAADFPRLDFALEPNAYNGSDILWVPDARRAEAMENGRLLLKTNGEGAEIGRLDIALSTPGGTWASVDAAVEVPNRYRSTTTELAPHIGRNASIQKLMDRYIALKKFVPVPEIGFESSRDYLTASSCKECHQEQYEAWEATGHARAFETLESAREEQNFECVPCHVVGYGETFVDVARSEPFQGVQCESCHGTNPEHAENPEKHRWKKVEATACYGCHNPAITGSRFQPKTMIPKIQCPPLDRR